MSRCFVIKPISCFKLGKSGLNLDQQSIPIIYPLFGSEVKKFDPYAISVIWNHLESYPGFFSMYVTQVLNRPEIAHVHNPPKMKTNGLWK